MQINIDDKFKDAIEWTCKYANEYKVDIDIHIDADGEVSVSVCPTYRDRDTADTPLTDLAEDAPRLEVTREEFEKIAEQIKDTPLKIERLTDCGWGKPNE